MPFLKITVTLKKSVEDAEGQSVIKALKLLGYENVKNVRTGKVYFIELENGSIEEGREFCSKLLSNPVINECKVELDGT
jgi:phosphoribosylformylglycinamidine synthase